jgi:hypothetical protein
MASCLEEKPSAMNKPFYAACSNARLGCHPERSEGSDISIYAIGLTGSFAMLRMTPKPGRSKQARQISTLALKPSAYTKLRKLF